MKQSTYKELKKKLKKLNIHSQEDLISLLIAATAKKWHISDGCIMQWVSEVFPDSHLTYSEPDGAVLEGIEAYDLAWVVSEADSLLTQEKRTQTGSFYTPHQWVWMMVQLALSDFVSEKLSLEFSKAQAVVKALSKANQDLGPDTGEALSIISGAMAKALYEAIQGIRVIDIACGAGAFLLEVVEVLTNMQYRLGGFLGYEHERVNLARLFYSKCVSGIDKQQYPLLVYGLCLIWRYGLETTSKAYPSVFQQDSLDNAVYLERPLLKTLEAGGFDIVIGNPPYLGEKGNVQVFKDIKKTAFGKAHYEGKMDLSYFFTIKGLDLLKPSGNLTYLTTNYFITADGAVKYRKTLHERTWFKYILNFNTYPIFKDALGQHNMIYMLKSKADKRDVNGKTRIDYVLSSAHENRVSLQTEEIIQRAVDKDYVNTYDCPSDQLYNADGTISILSHDTHRSVLSAYEALCDCKLKDIFNINQGIVSGADQVSKHMLRTKLSERSIKKYHIEKGMPIFVFDAGNPKVSELEQDLLRPFYKNSDIDTYIIRPRTQRFIIYLDDYIDTFEQNYPALNKHLSQFKEVLDKRREVQTGTRPWYGLQWPRNQQVFEGPKIVVPQRSKVNRFAYTRQPFYCSADVYYFKERIHTNADMSAKENMPQQAWWYYLGMLNASVLYLWLYHNGKRKGELLELYAKPLLETYIPSYKGALWQMRIAKTVENIVHMLEAGGHYNDENIQVLSNQIDELIFEQMNLDQDTKKVISEFHRRHQI